MRRRMLTSLFILGTVALAVYVASQARQGRMAMWRTRISQLLQCG